MNCLANLTLRWRSLKTAQHTYQHNRRRIKSIFFNGADFLEDLFFRYANISIAGSPGRLAYFVYQNLHFSFFFRGQSLSSVAQHAQTPYFRDQVKG